MHGEELLIQFWLETLKNHEEDEDIGGRIRLKWILEKQAGMVYTGFIWLRTGSSVAIMRT
jgi:hypothetical protein